MKTLPQTNLDAQTNLVGENLPADLVEEIADLLAEALLRDLAETAS